MLISLIKRYSWCQIPPAQLMPARTIAGKHRPISNDAAQRSCMKHKQHFELKDYARSRRLCEELVELNPAEYP
jgi:hypothetical protein